MDFQPDSHLVKLPTELIHRMASFLPTPDLCSARLTCRALEKSLFTHFNLFFKKKQFMFTEDSLQALINISEHPSLSPCLQHLIIGLDHFESIDGHGHIRVRLPDAESLVRYKKGAAAQRRLMNLGNAAELLSKALNNFTNLHTIDIRDFNSRSRFRDSVNGSPGYWTSYGSSTLAKPSEMNNRLSMRSSNNHLCRPEDKFVNRAFEVVLAAMAGSSSRPQTLMVILRDRHWGLADCAFDLDPMFESRLAPVLTNLKTVHLDLSLEENPFHAGLTSGDIADPVNTRIRHFLSCTPNVTWLRLNFQSSPRQPSTRFLNWLVTLPGSNPTAKALPWLSDATINSVHPVPWNDSHNPAPIALPLEQLDIGPSQPLSVTPHMLQSLVSKFTDLHTLSFIGATIYPSHISSTPGRNDRVNLWAGFIRMLSGKLPASFRRLTLRKLYQSDADTGAACAVYFKLGKDAPVSQGGLLTVKDLTDVSKEKLEELAEVTMVSWPVPDSEGGEDEEEDDENEEEEVVELSSDSEGEV